jgi:hypothetical protein
MNINIELYKYWSNRQRLVGDRGVPSENSFIFAIETDKYVDLCIYILSQTGRKLVLINEKGKNKFYFTKFPFPYKYFGRLNIRFSDPEIEYSFIHKKLNYISKYKYYFDKDIKLEFDVDIYEKNIVNNYFIRLHSSKIIKKFFNTYCYPLKISKFVNSQLDDLLPVKDLFFADNDPLINIFQDEFMDLKSDIDFYNFAIYEEDDIGVKNDCSEDQIIYVNLNDFPINIFVGKHKFILRKNHYCLSKVKHSIVCDINPTYVISIPI